MKHLHMCKSFTPVFLAGLLLIAPELIHAQMGQGAASAGGAADSSAQSGGMTGGGGGAATPKSSGGSGPSVLYGLKPANGEVPVITLDEVMRLALERNYDLRIAAEQIVQANTVIRRAWATVLPRLNVGGQYVYTTPVTEISFLDQEAVDGQKQQLEGQALLLRTMGQLTAQSDPAGSEKLYAAAAAMEDAANKLQPMDPIAIQPAHLFTANAQVVVPLFNGRTLPLLFNSYDMVDQAKLSLDRARQQALFGVASLYFSATTVKRLMGIVQNNLESAKSHLAASEARVSAGALPAIALKRAQYDVIQAEQTVRSTHSTYLLLLGSLGQLIGRDTAFDVVAPESVAPHEQQGSADLFYERALASRRDLKALRVALEISERGMMDYWLRYAPSLNLVGQANWTSNTSGFQSDPITYNVVLQASIPLYDGGERYAVRDEAASKIRQAKLQIEKSEQETAALIRGNLQDIQLRLESLASSQAALELARDNHANAKALFDVGAATNLEVIDAQAAELAAEIDLARVELELQVARLGLLFVVGEYPALEGMKASPRPAPTANPESAPAQ
ncbi:MAG: TolC family protein [Pseudomonadota bacterium]